MTDALDAIARDVIDANRYMTLGTADESGLPWVCPVWFAPAGYRQFLWVSHPEARHSRNIAVRPTVSIVIFNSQVPEGSAQAVYMAAEAEELTGDALAEGIAVVSDHSQALGMGAWGVVDETGAVAPAGGSGSLHLYLATASDQFVLDPAAATDSRTRVTP